MWGDQGNVAGGGEGDIAGLSGFEKGSLGCSEGTKNPVVWVEDNEEEQAWGKRWEGIWS